MVLDLGLLAEEVLHDDVVGGFFEISEDQENFDAEYIGGNEFALYYKRKSKPATSTQKDPGKTVPKPTAKVAVEDEREDP